LHRHTKKEYTQRKKLHATEIVSGKIPWQFSNRCRENIFSTLWSANVLREKLCGNK